MTDNTVKDNHHKLRQDLLDNISLIKRMFSVEQTLRTKLEEEERKGAERERLNWELQVENTELRERIEILESMFLEGSHKKREEVGKCVRRERKCGTVCAPSGPPLPSPLPMDGGSRLCSTANSRHPREARFAPG